MDSIIGFFNTGNLIVFGIFAFLGICFGWFFKSGNYLFIFIGVLFFAPLLDWLIEVDYWFITIAFVAGFLVHTWKPLARRLEL